MRRSRALPSPGSLGCPERGAGLRRLLRGQREAVIFWLSSVRLPPTRTGPKHFSSKFSGSRSCAFLRASRESVSGSAVPRGCGGLGAGGGHFVDIFPFLFIYCKQCS